MMHRYRILGAVLALRSFTVAELARHAGVKESTVYTNLRREGHFVERVDAPEPTVKRRGGQRVQYQLRSGAEQELVTMLTELEKVGAASLRGVSVADSG